MQHITYTKYKLPPLSRRYTWYELTDIAKEYFPEFRAVLPMGDYIKTLAILYKRYDAALPYEIRILRKVALGNCWIPRPNSHLFIGVESQLNNADRVWIFFHELGHLVNNHVRTAGKKRASAVAKAHDRAANRFAYEEILRRGLISNKNMEKFESFYRYVKTRDGFVKDDMAFTAADAALAQAKMSDWEAKRKKEPKRNSI